MNMAGMNPATGGPVGGMVMMNNASTPGNGDSNEQIKIKLHTHIYDYLLKNGFHECARALFRDDKVQLSTLPNTKQSPNRQVNGIDDAMDTESKDDSRIPDDLPRPNVPDGCPGSSFLFDWYALFSEMFMASRAKGKGGTLSTARQYLAQTENLQRMRESQQNGQMLRNPQMVANQMGQFNGMRNMRNGAMSQDMQKNMMRNNMTPQQMQQMAQQKQMIQSMQRDQSDMEMNGHRPQSPASGENVGSPNKRPRLEGGQFNGQPMGPNGRGQGMPPQQGQNAMQTLMKNGINPSGLTPQQFQSFQNSNPNVQQKSIQVYAQNLAAHHNRSAMNQGAMPNGMMNPGVMPNQGSPLMQPMNENFMMDPTVYNPAVNPQLRGGMPQGAGGQGGNHALQDYQMQLMLLEQQNKKRLMMARQEQDSITRADGQPGIPAGQGMVPPGMSPSGSRNGPSPNPNDMKRTPQLGQTGLPGSPTQGGPGGSPTPMHYNGQMPQDFNPQMFPMNKMGENMMAAGQGMRPPNSMNPNMQGGRMPGGNWQQGGPGPQPMMQQPSQGGPQAIGTPQQRNEMPPPQAPAAGANAGRGTQPSSPHATQAPPTPQQANKANPTKGKKGKGGDAKRPQKKGSTAAAAGASGANVDTSGDPPATPTPSTPITPVHPSSFNKNGPGSGNANANTSAPTSAPQPSTQNQPPQQSNNMAGGANDPNSMAAMANAPFGDFNGVDPSFNLDFGPLDAPDVLENFDFDSFLNNPDDGGTGVGGFSFDAAGLGLEGGYGVEGGAEV